jgi:hypothetical protein
VDHARARKVSAQLVEDDYQLRYERVAGIDVAKARADVCTRLPAAREGGRRVSRVETVGATAGEVLALAGRLIADGIELAVMEARDILEAIVAGERDPKVLAARTHGNVKGGSASIEKAPEGMVCVPAASAVRCGTSRAGFGPSAGRRPGCRKQCAQGMGIHRDVGETGGSGTIAVRRAAVDPEYECWRSHRP